MSIMSYILLLSFRTGFEGDFDPEKIINYCTFEIATLLIEIILIKLVSYGLGYTNIGIIDIIALVSYKNVQYILYNIIVCVF